MSYFYLQVKRLDGDSACAFFYPMGTDMSKVDARKATMLDSYRGKGFQIIHFPNDPNLKHARRKSDGVRLELLVIEEDRPIKLALNVDLGGAEDENHATAH